MKRLCTSGMMMLLALFARPASAQQPRLVTGAVHSATTGQPVAGVSVRVRGLATIAHTTAAGTFSIQVPAASTDILVFSSAGYDGMDVELMGKSSADVQLIPSLRFNQYGVEVPRLPVAGEARDGILVFESKDGEYKFWLDLRIQLDAAFFYDNDSTLNALGRGFEARRARMAFKSQFMKDWYAELDMDFANGTADLEDLYVTYTPHPALEFKAGNFKEVFSTEVTTTSRYTPFMERPMMTRALAPSRALGIGARYHNPYLMTAVGLHFEDISDAEVITARKDNNEATGTPEGYSVTGKLVALPIKTDSVRGIHLAVAASYRTPKTDDQVGKVRYATRELANINRKKYLDTDRITEVDHVLLRGLEAAAYYRGFRAQGEYTQADVHRIALPTERFSGYYGMATMMLFGGSYRYNPVEAEFTQPRLGQKWGDLELAGRFEHLNLNSRIDGIMGGAAEGVTVGLNFYPNNNVKIVANYGWLNLDRWATGRGKLFVGRDSLGVPTKNPRLVADPTGKAGDDHRSLQFRIQVSF